MHTLLCGMYFGSAPVAAAQHTRGGNVVVRTFYGAGILLLGLSVFCTHAALLAAEAARCGSCDRPVCQEPPGAAEVTDMAPDAEASDSQTPEFRDVEPPDTAVQDLLSPQPQRLAGTFGAVSGPRATAPMMIGDAFGTSSIYSIISRRMYVLAPGITAVYPSPSPSPYTASQSGTYYITNQSHTPLVSMSGLKTFTTAISTDQMLTLIGNDPNAKLPIIDNSGYHAAVQGVGQSQYGSGGLATFLPNYSYATVEEFLSPPSPGGDDVGFAATYAYDYLVSLNVPLPGATVGRVKIAEATSPMPRDRVLLNYSYFDNVPLMLGGVNVHRFTPGVEKTFHDGLMSLEVKVPMAVTLNSTIVQNGTTGISDGELGNMMLTYKQLLLAKPTWAVSAGLSVTVPTADDVNVVGTDGTSLVNIANRSVMLGPFFGALWTPNDRFFAQGFLQYQVDTNGNPVSVNTTGSMSQVGTIHDATYQYLDLGIGWWAHRDPNSHGLFKGLAYTAELHWNTTLQDSDAVSFGNLAIGSGATNIETINLILGGHVELAHDTTVSLAYTAPLGGGVDQEFDGELRLFFNRFFGTSSRVPRVPAF